MKRSKPKTLFLDMNGYQWLVIFAAWLGWGFDIFDGLLFNYVAPNCIPVLLSIPIGTAEAKAATMFWTGIITSLLLLGWALGGILFGKLADRIGRTKTLLLTMLLYSAGTAACSLAPNIWVLILCRIVASLGIGGEWAAGASMVAEVVPEKRRVEAGAILYSSAPMGLFLASFVNMQIAGNLFKDQPEVSWRYIFLFGLIPSLAAFFVRSFVKEPERWQAKGRIEPKIADLFTAKMLPVTRSGFFMAFIALLAWWSCNAFLPVISAGLAAAKAHADQLDRPATLALVESWKTTATNIFNLGGLIGTLLTIPLAKHLGRKLMFSIYFLGSSLAIFTAFGMDWAGETRLYLFFLLGLSVFGVFGSFTYYLPELFPTKLRATGSGFCYNVGRTVASVGPFAVGYIASTGGLQKSLNTLFWIGLVPLVGLALMPWVIETKGKELAD